MSTPADDPRRIHEDPGFPDDLRSLLGTIHEDGPSAAALERLSAALQHAGGAGRTARPSRPRLWRLPPRATAFSFAAAVVVLVGALALRHRSPTVETAAPGTATNNVSTILPPADPTALQAPAREDNSFALPTAPAPPLPIGESLATFDFEDVWESGSRTRRIAGRRAPGPPGGVGGRVSLAGVIFTPEQKSFGVQVRDDAGLFPYSEDIVVAFDYWIGEWTAPEPPQMVFGLQFGPVTTGLEYEMALPDPVAVRWMTAVVRLRGLHVPFQRDRSGRLTDFRAATHSPPPRRWQPDRPQPGQIATMFKVRVEGVRQDVLFIDNVRIIRQKGR